MPRSWREDDDPGGAVWPRRRSAISTRSSIMPSETRSGRAWWSGMLPKLPIRRGCGSPVPRVCGYGPRRSYGPFRKGWPATGWARPSCWRPPLACAGARSWDSGGPTSILIPAAWRYVRRSCRSATKSCSAVPRRPRGLRHTHASLAAGIPAKIMSERLGHATVAFTQDVYMHSIPPVEDAAADQLGRLIFGDDELPRAGIEGHGGQTQTLTAGRGRAGEFLGRARSPLA